MKDNFSAQADIYAKYRPQYPQELFDFILKHVHDLQLAWDCGTGNGQSAAILGKYFKKVFASDISKKQIENAVKADNIQYALEPAEKTSLNDNSVDLVTISQALHWFEFDKFYSEVKRVSKQHAVIATWTYNLIQVDPVTDKLIYDYHFNTLGDYWDKERSHVIEGYKNIPFPFRPIATPAFFIELKWTPEDLEGYFNTWSALQKFITANNYSPVDELMIKIRLNWAPGESRQIRFPLDLKMGNVH